MGKQGMNAEFLWRRVLEDIYLEDQGSGNINNIKMNFMELDCEDWRLRIVSSGVEYLVSSSKEFVDLITTLAVVVVEAAAVVIKVHS
jgi:hypothetical protein